MNPSIATSLRRQTAASLGILLIVAGAILLWPLTRAFGDQATAPAPPAVAGEPVEAGPSAALSPAQEAEALAVARAHPAIRALMARRGVKTLVVPWTTLAGDRLLGAGIDITWEQPAAAAGRWPALYYDETETLSPPYLRTTAAVEASNVTGVHVSVDLSGGDVVQLEPMPGARVKRFDPNEADRAGLPPQPMNPR